jgi:putative FmdB family regulatory protein
LVPTYEYRCDNCDRNFDVVQSFEDDPLTQCPTCESPVRKVFGSVGIVFKGTGFYKTDSRNGAGAKGASSRESTDAKDASSGSSDKGAGSESTSTDGGTKGAEQKGGSGSDPGKGKSPASATSTSS